MPSSRPHSRRASFAVLSVAVAALASAGCAASPFVRAAEQGKYEGLKASLAADVEQGRIGIGEAARFARAVASGEVERAKGEDGAQRIRELLSCAREVDGALDRRADTRDTLGAVAALVRLDAGISGAGRYSRWARIPVDAPEAAWRALGARSLTSSGDAELRRAMFADPDEEVRRSALRAALEAADPDDVEGVLESARVDPSPAARAQAIRAAGVIGGERAVLALKDIWPRADEDVREEIVGAWATHASFNAGGRRELVGVVEHHHGRAAIGAASVLIRAGGEGSDEARGALERAVKEGPTADRARAIMLASLRVASLREAVIKAMEDPDDGVAAVAMARLFAAPPELGGPKDSAARAAISSKLLKLADGHGPGSAAAKGALAQAHDPRLLPILKRDGEAKNDKTREQAGTALAVYGDLARAAVVAADPEPRVRVTVACAILRAWAAK
jgi:hypothetical protein